MLKISTRGRYGLRAMLELGLHHGGPPTLLCTISESQDLSKKYLHALLTDLRSAGLVRSIRGSKGGFMLVRSPEAIDLCEIVAALEGPLSPVDCVEDADVCDKADGCVVREVWQDLTDVIQRHLSGITLADLLERHRAVSQQAPPPRSGNAG